MTSAGMVLSVPNPIKESPRDGVAGPIAALEQRAATLSKRAIQAAAVARDAAADAADINNAHATIVAQHQSNLMRLGTTLCSLQDFTTVDIIGSLPTRPIIPHNYFARQQKVLRRGKMLQGRSTRT